MAGDEEKNIYHIPYLFSAVAFTEISLNQTEPPLVWKGAGEVMQWFAAPERYGPTPVALLPPEEYVPISS